MELKNAIHNTNDITRGDSYNQRRQLRIEIKMSHTNRTVA